MSSIGGAIFAGLGEGMIQAANFQKAKLLEEWRNEQDLKNYEKKLDIRKSRGIGAATRKKKLDDDIAAEAKKAIDAGADPEKVRRRAWELQKSRNDGIL